MTRIEEYIANKKRRTLAINDFISQYHYSDLVYEIERLVAAGVLVPWGKKRNSLKPPLYHNYAINRPVDEKQMAEIRRLPPYFSNQYYLAHPDDYENDKPYIEQLTAFYEKRKDLLDFPATVNERAYQMVGDEKWIDGRQPVLDRLGIIMDSLNVFPTPEPFHYLQFNTPIRTVLIAENKDAFYDIKKLAMGKLFRLWDTTFDLLVYGEGNHIEQSFAFMEELTTAADVTVWYWGDIDYAGIGMYQRLAKNFPQARIMPHCRLYAEMLDREQNPPPQKTKVAKADKKIDGFLSFFTEERKQQIRRILEKGRRIPQETLPYQIMSELVVR